MVARPDDRKPADAVAIVTGGSWGAGRELAHELARRGFAVVVVYLRDQWRADAVVDAILAARGVAVTVRADVTDGLDVERLFDETTAAFEGADVLVHAARRGAPVLYPEAWHRLRPGGIILSVAGAETIGAALFRDVRAHGIAVCAHDVAGVLARVDRWSDPRGLGVEG